MPKLTYEAQPIAYWPRNCSWSNWCCCSEHSKQCCNYPLYTWRCL